MANRKKAGGLDAEHTERLAAIREEGRKLGRQKIGPRGELPMLQVQAGGYPFGPHLLHEITGGEKGTPAPEKESGIVWLLATSFWGGAEEVLTERYLEETGLPLLEAAAAAKYLEWDSLQWHDGQKLRQDEIEQYIQDSKTLSALFRLVIDSYLPEGRPVLWDELELETAPKDTPGVTNADVQAASELIERADAENVVLQFGGDLLSGPHLQLPSAPAIAERVRRLRGRMLMTREERTAAADKALTRDGTRRQSVGEWLAAAGWPGPVWAYRVRIALEHAQGLEDERNLRKEAERKLKRAEQKLQKLEGLSDRTIFPAQLIEGGYKPTRLHKTLERLEQNELFHPAGSQERTLEVLRNVEIITSQTQLGRLPADEVRALFGVFRLFSGTEEERTLAESRLVPANILYKAAGVTSRRDKDRRRLFDALRTVSSQEIAVAVKGKTSEGKPWVIGDRAPMFRMRPVWSESTDGRRKLQESQAAEVAEEWAAIGASSESWTGPLPDHFEFSLPDIMRRVLHRLVLKGDALERLDAGAKEARGAAEKFHPLDWRLFLEVTQTVQATQEGRSFVDREALLEDFYGAGKIATAREAGKYRSRYESQYDKAVQVLKEGNLAEMIERDYKTSDGEKRDIFLVSPDVMLGARNRLKKTARKRRLKAGQKQ